MKKTLSGLCLVGFCLSLAAPLLAQEETLARVAYWNVKRAHWSSYEENWAENQKPILDKLLADGKIKEYGFTRNFVHQEDGYTHVNWWTANNLAGIEAVFEALQARNDELSDRERARRTEELADSIEGHRDVLVHSVVFESRPSHLDRHGYIVGAGIPVKYGHDAEWMEDWTQHNKPLLDELLANGTILSYGMDIEIVHTEAPGIRDLWYTVPDAAAHARVRAANQAARNKLSKKDREARDNAFQSHVTVSKHRDSLNSIIYYAVN